MNTKAKGAAFERRVKKHFEERGCFVARQAASLFPDLVVIDFTGQAYLVECKCSGGLTQQERARFKELHRMYSVECFLARRREDRGIEIKRIF